MFNQIKNDYFNAIKMGPCLPQMVGERKVNLWQKSRCIYFF